MEGEWEQRIQKNTETLPIDVNFIYDDCTLGTQSTIIPPAQNVSFFAYAKLFSYSYSVEM